MYCSIHMLIHPMVGVDLHNGITPSIPPVPLPFLPHVVGSVLGGVPTPMSTVAKSKNVLSYGFNVIQRASDIGMLIPHVPTGPNILAPLLLITSGSVSEFGAFSVHANDKPVAIAPLIMVGFNFNCYDPVMWNTNLVLAPGLNLANFTIADMVASLASIAVDMIISGIFYVGFNGIGKFAGLNGLTSNLVGRVSASSGIFRSIFGRPDAIATVVNGVVGYIIGTPVGIGSGSNDFTSGSFFDQQIDETMADYYENGENF